MNVKVEGEGNAQDNGLFLVVGGGLERSGRRGMSLASTVELTTGEEYEGEEEEEDATMVAEGRVDEPCAGGVSRELTNKNRFPLTSSLDS